MRRDWNISRNRFWGSCLPVWVNVDDPEDRICVGSRAELESLSGVAVEDLHKHVVDEIVIHRDGKDLSPHARGPRLLVRVGIDALRAAALSLRAHGRARRLLSGPLHRRGTRSDARLVLHDARPRDQPLREESVSQRDRERDDPRERRQEDVEAAQELSRSQRHPGDLRRRRAARVHDRFPGRAGRGAAFRRSRSQGDRAHGRAALLERALVLHDLRRGRRLRSAKLARAAGARAARHRSLDPFGPAESGTRREPRDGGLSALYRRAPAGLLHRRSHELVRPSFAGALLEERGRARPDERLRDAPRGADHLLEGARALHALPDRSGLPAPRPPGRRDGAGQRALGRLSPGRVGPSRSGPRAPDGDRARRLGPRPPRPGRSQAQGASAPARAHGGPSRRSGAGGRARFGGVAVRRAQREEDLGRAGRERLRDDLGEAELQDPRQALRTEAQADRRGARALGLRRGQPARGRRDDQRRRRSARSRAT